MTHDPLNAKPAAGASQAWVADHRASWLLGGLAWTLIVLMIVPENFDYSALDGAAPATGDATSRILWLALLWSGILVVLWRAALAWLVLRALNPYLLAFVGLALASMIWSIEPAFTVRRDLRFLTILIDTLALTVMAWHVRRFQNLLRPIVTLMLAGSIVFGLLCPRLAIHQDTAPELLHAWRGLANHKNSLGALAGTGLIFWFHAWWTREARPLKAFAGAALAAVCLVLSRSSTALMTAVFASLFMALLLRSSPRMRPYVPYLVGLFSAALLLYALVILRVVPGLDLLLAPVVALSGKDLSFTGRADIWQLITAHIHLHPWLGTGYGAYWIGPVLSSPSYEFLTRLQFYPGSAHNGYLEVINDLGLAGGVCLLGYLVVYLRQALLLFRLDLDQGALYLALFLEQAISNLSESHWLNALSVGFVFATFATTSLARALLETQLRRYFGEPGFAAPREPETPPGFDHAATA